MQRNYVTIRLLNREDSVLYFPPEAIGPFRVLHQIGAGTLGPVFRAYEPGRDRLVAIKIFRLDLTPEQSTALVGHLNELIAANIAHPSIAAPIAAGLDGGTAYLVQEFVVGDSLDVVLRERGLMSIEDVVPLVESLASAIDHAASRGMHQGALHMRDIIFSPSAARITGFGIAGALAKISAKLPTRPQYSPPDAPSDVYALAAIAFEAVTGKRVSPDNLKEFVAAHGAELGGAFSVALAANADMRPERAGDFAEVLRDAAAMTAEAGARGASGAPGAGDELDAAGAGDLDLRIDQPVDLMTEPELDPQPEHDPEPQSRRWPIVAIFLACGILAALSVGFFLKSPTPAATIEPNAGVDQTTVDLPASSQPRAPVPPPEPPQTLPAPAPSRPASGAVAPADKPARGSLLIRSTPADAEVLVNGRARGKTPIAVRDLALGSYTIRVARDGYVTEERTLELTARRPSAAAMFSLRPGVGPATGAAGKPGSVVVQSRPAGARVFLNGRLVGSTPLGVPDVPTGPATVRIELDGYQVWMTTVRVEDGRPARVAASLERK